MARVLKPANNPSLPYHGLGVGTTTPDYKGANPSHDPSLWASLFGTMTHMDNTPISHRYPREAFHVPDDVNLRSHHLEKVIISNVYKQDHWEFRAMPLIEKNDTVIVSGQEWIADDHLLSIVPAEAPSRMVTSHFESWSESMQRRGIGFKMTIDSMHTKKGQTEYWMSNTQITNATVTTAQLSAVTAIVETDKNIKKYASDYNWTAHEFEKKLDQDINHFGMAQKQPYGIDIAINEANEEIRHEGASGPTVTVIPSGTLNYAKFRSENSDYFRNGKAGGPQINVSNITSGELVQYRRYKVGNNEPDYDPFYREQVIGGRFHLGAHNIGGDTKYSTRMCNTKIYNETTDGFTQIKYGENVLNKLGLWRNKELTHHIGRAFFTGDTEQSDIMDIRSSYRVSNSGYGDSDSDSDSDSDDDYGAGASLGGVPSALKWLTDTDCIGQVVDGIAEMKLANAKAAYDRIVLRNERAGKRRKESKYDAPAKRQQVSHHVPVALAAFDENGAKGAMETEAKELATANASTTINPKSNCAVFDTTTGSLTDVETDAIYPSLINFVVDSTKVGHPSSLIGHIAYCLATSNVPAVDGTGFGQKALADFTTLADAILNDIDTPLQLFPAVLVPPGNQAAKRLVHPIVASAVRVIQAATGENNLNDRVKAIIESYKLSTAPIVFDPAVSSEATNTRVLMRALNEATRSGTGAAGLTALFPTHANKTLLGSMESYQYLDLMNVLEKAGMKGHVDSLKQKVAAFRNDTKGDPTKKISGHFKKWMKTTTTAIKNSYAAVREQKLLHQIEEMGEQDSIYTLAVVRAIIEKKPGELANAKRLVSEYLRDPSVFVRNNLTSAISSAYGVSSAAFPPAQLLGISLRRIFDGTNLETATDAMEDAAAELKKAATATATATGVTVPPTTAIRQWLGEMSIGDYSFVQFLLAHDLQTGIIILGFRPHKRFRCGTLVHMVGGGAAGNTFHGFANFMIQKNASLKTIYGHFTTYLKAIVTNPKLVSHVRNVFISEYIGGNGCRILDPCNEDHTSLIRQGETDIGDVFLCAVPATWSTDDSWYTDISGQFAPAIRNALNNGTKVLWPGAEIYRNVWGWADPTNILDGRYWKGQKQGYSENFSSICIQEAQHNPDKSRIPERGHLGEPFCGLRSVHNGYNATQSSRQQMLAASDAMNISPY